MSKKKSGYTARGVAASKKKTNGKQIAAIIAIILLILMYLATLITAIFDTTASGFLFRASLIATFTIPLITWVYIWMYGKLSQKHTMADFDLGKDPDKKAEEKDEAYGREEEE